MKAYVLPQADLSRAMTRVSNALATHAPAGIEIVTTEAEADLVVLHVIGWPETLLKVREITNRGQTFAMIQYCFRTTQRASAMSWLPLWAEAQVVWSYYDLKRISRAESSIQFDEPNWYCAPLGGDPDVFRAVSVEPQTVEPREYTILTSGYVAETEGVIEAAEAVARVGGKQFHLGPDLGLNSGVRVDYRLGIADNELADAYRSAQFVAGLRRLEGFELPAVEGLLCGARPIMFDAPHYRQWFDGFAEFIPEGSHQDVVEALTKLFEQGPRPVTPAERMAASACFDWETIVTGFWEKMRA